MKLKNISWFIAGFIIFYHVLLLIGLPFYFYNYSPSLSLILISVALFFLTGLSITVGYHRYYSHRTFKPNKFVEMALLFFGTLAIEGSVIRWSYNHRLHHRFTDSEEDPHSIKKGFWYAHMIWLFEKPKPIDKKVIPDLINNKILLFQDKHFRVLATVLNLAMCFLIGYLLDDFVGAFFIASWLRIFLVHHVTWFINSLAHTWGEKTFSREESAVDNYVVSLLTFGEGYHNYHHVFSSDYRNGTRWYHFDPSKWIIWTLSKIGLAKDLKKIDSISVKRFSVLEDRKYLLQKISSFSSEKESMEQRINQLSDRVIKRLEEIRKLAGEYRNIKKTQYGDKILEYKRKLKNTKKSFKKDWKSWCKLVKEISKKDSPNSSPAMV